MKEGSDNGCPEMLQVYRIPQSDAEKIVLNGEYIFPETNSQDNYRYTKGFFANQKKIRFKIFKDIPNPEYNEIYINPRVNFNVYDRCRKITSETLLLTENLTMPSRPTTAADWKTQWEVAPLPTLSCQLRVSTAAQTLGFRGLTSIMTTTLLTAN